MAHDTEVDVVRSNSAAFSAKDIDGMLAHYAPDAVVVDKRPGGLLGTFTGHDELRPYYLGIFHAADVMKETLTVLAARDGVVVCDCELRGILANDLQRNEISAPYGLVVHVRDGLIRYLEIHADGQAALEESGLEPDAA